MEDLRTSITSKLRKYLTEGYDDVSMDDIRGNKKLSDHKGYDNRIVIDGHTYINFTTKDKEWYLWGKVMAFDNIDGTEVANSTYGKISEYTPMKASIDVRSDKRRLGIASNIYKWIEQLTGEKLYPETPHSKSAEALWNNPKRAFGYDK